MVLVNVPIILLILLPLISLPPFISLTPISAAFPPPKLHSPTNPLTEISRFYMLKGAIISST